MSSFLKKIKKSKQPKATSTQLMDRLVLVERLERGGVIEVVANKPQLFITMDGFKTFFYDESGNIDDNKALDFLAYIRLFIELKQKATGNSPVLPIKDNDWIDFIVASHDGKEPVIVGRWTLNTLQMRPYVKPQPSE